jgi:hypothetical protein
LSASDRRVQLWRSPLRGRPAELRRYAWTGAASSCAAVAPEAGLAVTGTLDRHVLVWALPSADEVRRADEPNAVVSLIDEALDSGSRQVRIRAAVTRRPEGLIPGGTATMVVMPPQK